MKLLGKTNPGGTSFALHADTKRVAPYVVQSAVRIIKLSLYADGLGPGAGNQVVRGIIYDSGGNLVAQGDEVMIPAGQPVEWVDLPFGGYPSGIQLNAGTYNFGVIGGAVGSSIRVYGDHATSGAITSTLPLTISGNEITDAVRAAQGPVDGYLSGGGGGFGIYPDHTNLGVNTKIASTAGFRERSYPAQVLANNAKLYWRLGESSGTTASDASGNGNTGTYGTGVTLGQPGSLIGHSDTAAAFNNTSNAKVVAASYQPFVVGSSRTFMGWAYRLTTTDDDALFGGSLTASAGSSFCRVRSGGSDVGFRPYGNGGEYIWTAAWPGTNQWAHWALTYNDVSGVAELFINGVSKGTKTVAAGDHFNGAANDFFQAGAWSSAAGTSAMNGYLDEVAVFETILTSAQINAIISGSTSPVSADATRLDTRFPGHNWLKLTPVAVNDSMIADSAFQPAAASGQTWTVSADVVGTSGDTCRVWLQGIDSAGRGSSDRAFVDVTLTGTPQRAQVAITLADSATVAITYVVQNRTSTNPLWMTAPMLAHSVTAGDLIFPPYIANNSSTAGSSATRTGGRVQAPSSLLLPTTGYIAARIAPSYAAAGHATDRYIFGLATDSSNFLGAKLKSGTTGEIDAVNTAGGSETDAAQTRLYAAKEVMTVVMAWDATQVYLSINGAAFTSAAPGTRVLPSGLTFDIGSLLGAQRLSGSVQWFAAGSAVPSNSDVATLAATVGTPSFSALPAQPTMLWTGVDSNYIEVQLGQTNTDTYSDGASPTFGPADPLDFDLSVFATYINVEQSLPDEEDMWYGRLPFARAQAALDTGKDDPSTLQSGKLSWHGDLLDQERGSFAIVNRGGPLDGLVGERLQIVAGRGTDAERRVVAYCHTDADLISDISVPRRLFLALSNLGDEELTVEVSVLV